MQEKSKTRRWENVTTNWQIFAVSPLSGENRAPLHQPGFSWKKFILREHEGRRQGQEEKRPERQRRKWMPGNSESVQWRWYQMKMELRKLINGEAKKWRSHFQRSSTSPVPTFSNLCKSKIAVASEMLRQDNKGDSGKTYAKTQVTCFKKSHRKCRAFAVNKLLGICYFLSYIKKSLS